MEVLIFVFFLLVFATVLYKALVFGMSRPSKITCAKCNKPVVFYRFQGIYCHTDAVDEYNCGYPMPVHRKK